MRNMMEQRRVVLPVIVSVFTTLVFAALALISVAFLLPEPTGFFLTIKDMLAATFEKVPVWAYYAVLGGGVVLLVVLPWTIAGIRIGNRYAPSPYPEGLDLEKLNDEQYRIYSELHTFLRKGGFQIYPGYERDNVYLNGILFCTITKEKNAIYININKDMRRYDGRLDRSGYIAVHHTGGLPAAKERIYSIYKEYFKQFSARPKKRRPRPPQAPRPAAAPKPATASKPTKTR